MHSPRIGFVNAMVQCGYPMKYIGARGRWASNAVELYVRQAMSDTKVVQKKGPFKAEEVPRNIMQLGDQLNLFDLAPDL